jgi:hypothetical protein
MVIMATPKEELLFSFQSPREHYVADACVLWCFDDRVRGILDPFIKFLGFKHVDVVDLDGGAKALAGEDSPDRASLMRRLDASIRLHGTKMVVLTLHVDCGGYGYSKAFADAEAEYAHHREELARARDFVKQKHQDVEIRGYIIDFDGPRRIF